MKVGIILGSGLNDFIKRIVNPQILFEDKSGVHKKKVIKGHFYGNEIIVFSGRNHIYEAGYSKKILQNIEIARANNVKFMIITNAAGGINKSLKIGDLMLITSVINLFGKFIKSGLSEINFDRVLLNKVLYSSLKNNLVLKKGVYCATTGPQYESKSEIKFLRKIGADAVGMSTIPELYSASSFGIKVLGISCITNILSETSAFPVDHEEIIFAGKSVSEKLSSLISVIFENLI